MRINDTLRQPLRSCGKIVLDLVLATVVYMICRIAFIMENAGILGINGAAEWTKILKGGILFDTSAIMYTNSLWLLIVALPLHWKENGRVGTVAKWLFVVVNTLGAVVNLMDAVYFQFTERRTTVTFFQEFGNEDNLGRIFMIECAGHWYFVLLAAAIAFGLWKLYANPLGGWTSTTRRQTGATSKPEKTGTERKEALKGYYTVKGVALLFLVPLIVCGMRGGGFTKSSRPISMSNANQYASTPAQAAAVLNTPFSLFRTISKGSVKIPAFYADKTEMYKYYSPMHYPADSVQFTGKNVVVLIVESFAEEFIGARNKDLDGGTYKGYTEFIDSLLPHSTTFETTLCNGWVSIDAIPAILSSMPKMSKSFVTSPYATDDIPGLAKALDSKGYHTAFFHGADNSSMGFQGAAKSTGFKNYYGRQDYESDPSGGTSADFDGTWAIWDEEFLQYYCKKMSEMPEPFVTAVFTATSHHPFALPERYKSIYLDEGKHKLHKCIRYTDNALRQFFNTARKQSWYDNTIFVITADHASSKTTHEEYTTDLGDFRVPIIIYDPSGTVPAGTREGVMQHIDIMPTLLGILGYDKPYFSFGKDALNEPADWAMNWHNIPQYIFKDKLLQLSDDFVPKALYNFKHDRLLNHNIIDTHKTEADTMEHRLKAILQSYDNTMREKTYRQLQ